MQNGDSYKYGEARPAFAPWPGLVLNLLSPCYGPASPFAGAVAAMLVPFAVLAAKKHRVTVILLAVLMLVSLLLIGRIGLVDAFLTVRPLFYIITVYLIPLFLLSFSLLAAVGLETLANRAKGGIDNDGSEKVNNSSRIQKLVFLAVVLAFIPLAGRAAHLDLTAFNFDQTLPAMRFDVKAIVLNLVIVSLFAGTVLIACGKRFKSTNTAMFLLVSAFILNIISIVFVSRTSLPIQPFFDFPRAELLDYLKAHPGRALSITEHVMKPNANIVYGVSSMRVHNPLQPLGFTDYARLCGATLDDFRNQTYKAITSKINLASVKYIVAQSQPLDAPFKLLHITAEGISIYENPEALPEAYIVAGKRSVVSAAEALKEVGAPGFDGRSEVILENRQSEKNSGNAASFTAPKTDLVAADLKRISNTELEMKYKSADGGYMVVTDTFYPGWTATVDGKAVPIARANVLFRALAVPAGEHTVRMIYQPLSFIYGVWAASAALIILALITAWHFVVRNKTVAGARGSGS
jgi:hypothetical protein